MSCPLSKAGRLYEHQNISAIPNPGSKMAKSKSSKSYSPIRSFFALRQPGTTQRRLDAWAFARGRTGAQYAARVRVPECLGDSESGLKSSKLEELEKLFTNTYI